MRCPKCGFNSFDHNLVCPRCRKDLAAVRDFFNITVPVPGGVDFFSAPEERAGFSEMEDAPLELPEVAEIEPEEYEEDDDIVPAEEIDDIEPAAEDDEPEDIAPVEDVEVEAALLPEAGPIAAPPPRPNFAEALAQARTADDAIEIELDDDDMAADSAPLPVYEDFAAAMTQIKNTLVATGDLTAEDAEEAEAVEIEPETVMLNDDEGAEPETDPLETELMGELDQDLDDELADLVTGVDLAELEKMIDDENA